MVPFLMRNNTPVRVEYRVEDEGLQWGLRVALRRRDAVANGVQDGFNADAGLARSVDDVLRLAADEVYYLVGHFLRHGVREVDFIENRDDFQVGPDGEV
jgi:hypothetical protein